MAEAPPPPLPAPAAADPPAAATSLGLKRGFWAALAARAASEGAGGLGVSLAVHGVVLLIAALWAVDTYRAGGGLMLSVTPGVEEDTFLEELSTAKDLAGSAAPVLQAPPIEPEPIDPDGLVKNLLGDAAPAIAGTGGEGTGAGEGDGSGSGAGQVSLPGGGNAVQAGSFTAWTIPPDPRPRQNYVIVIQVDLPENLRLRKYPKRDLYGEVRGTDDYRQRLPGDGFADRTGFLPIRNGKVQFAVAVPGADRLVKDRIKVGSRLLKESQTLELVF